MTRSKEWQRIIDKRTPRDEMHCREIADQKQEIERLHARHNYIATHLPPGFMTEEWNRLNAEFDGGMET